MITRPTFDFQWPLTIGQQTGTVTGLGLSFTPKSGTFPVQGDSGLLIFVTIMSLFTSDGFSYFLNAAPDTGNYKIVGWLL
jgi:hypothetical protein